MRGREKRAPGELGRRLLTSRVLVVEMLGQIKWKCKSCYFTRAKGNLLISTYQKKMFEWSISVLFICTV